MGKLTMHDEIQNLLMIETGPDSMTTQPQITKRLRYDAKGGSRSLVLRELYERNSNVHSRLIKRTERKPEHGKARFFWWWDESKLNEHFANPGSPLPDDDEAERDYPAIIDKLIDGLASSDFVLACGERAIQEMRVYREDLALDLQNALT